MLACGISGELGQENKVSVPLSKTELISGEAGELGSYPLFHLVLMTSLTDKQAGESFSPFYRWGN